MNRKIEIYCPDDTVLNVSTNKPRKYLKRDYGRYFLEEIVNIASNRDLNGTDLRVLLCIIGNLKYENILNISQKQLGEILNIKQQEISKSIKKFLKKEYLQIVDKIGRQNIYQFNPNIVFRSRAENHKNLCNEWEKDNDYKKENIEIKIEKNQNENLQIKFDEKINQISDEFDIEKEKAKDILLLIINQGLNRQSMKNQDLPY